MKPTAGHTSTLTKLGAFVAFVLLGACGDDGGLTVANGGACERDSWCESQTCVSEILDGEFEFPNGMCMTDCSGDPEACMPGAEDCLPVALGSEQAYCALRCVADEGCRVTEGYACLQLSPFDFRRWCLPESLRRPWDAP